MTPTEKMLEQAEIVRAALDDLVTMQDQIDTGDGLPDQAHQWTYTQEAIAELTRLAAWEREEPTRDEAEIILAVHDQYEDSGTEGTPSATLERAREAAIRRFLGIPDSDTVTIEGLYDRAGYKVGITVIAKSKSADRGYLEARWSIPPR